MDRGAAFADALVEKKKKKKPVITEELKETIKRKHLWNPYICLLAIDHKTELIFFKLSAAEGGVQ